MKELNLLSIDTGNPFRKDVFFRMLGITYLPAENAYIGHFEILRGLFSLVSLAFQAELFVRRRLMPRRGLSIQKASRTKALTR